MRNLFWDLGHRFKIYVFFLKQMKNLILSGFELYFSHLVDLETGLIKIEGEESNHLVKVMRNKIKEKIYITNGNGTIFNCEIVQIEKDIILSKILHEFKYEKRYGNLFFCIPVLRSHDRFEFALEKCTELGITNFIIYNAERSIGKVVNQKRIEKILTSSIKQSLLSWLPKVQYYNSLKDIVSEHAKKIIFDQSSAQYFDKKLVKQGEDYFFIFGPEGGLSADEINIFQLSEKFRLNDNRLRTETAIVKAASLL